MVHHGVLISLFLVCLHEGRCVSGWDSQVAPAFVTVDQSKPHYSAFSIDVSICSPLFCETSIGRWGVHVRLCKRYGGGGMQGQRKDGMGGEEALWVAAVNAEAACFVTVDRPGVVAVIIAPPPPLRG